MDAAHKQHMTEAEYLEFERDSTEKHEFVNGEIIDMSGGTPRHSLIAANLTHALMSRIAGRPCLVFSSDLRVNVAVTSMYAYPDLTMVCGHPQYHAKDRNIVLNPTLLIEVLSDSTAGYDRGPKAAHYRRLPTLKEYLFVSQDERLVEHYRRSDNDQWLLTASTGERTIPIHCLDAEISLDEIYARVELLEPTGPDAGSTGAAS